MSTTGDNRFYREPGSTGETPTLILATWHTRNYEWQGVGLTERDAAAALIAGYEAHADTTPGAYPDLAREGFDAGDFAYQELAVGRAYRDGNRTPRVLDNDEAEARGFSPHGRPGTGVRWTDEDAEAHDRLAAPQDAWEAADGPRCEPGCQRDHAPQDAPQATHGTGSPDTTR